MDAKLTHTHQRFMRKDSEPEPYRENCPACQENKAMSPPMLSPQSSGSPITEDEVMGYFHFSSDQWDTLPDETRQKIYDLYYNHHRPLHTQAPALFQILRAWVESTDASEQRGSMRPVYDQARALLAHIEEERT